MRTTAFFTTKTNPKARGAVLIVGVSGGIGRALAERFRGENLALYATALGGRKETAEWCAREVGAGAFSSARVFNVDLSRSEDLDFLLAATLDALEGDSLRLEAVAFAAGVDLMSENSRALSYAERLETAWRVDALATILLARKLGDEMRRAAERDENYRPAMVMFGWDGVRTGRAGETSSIYGAVKGAVTGFARSLAHELAPYVRVNVVAPGWIATRWGGGDDATRARLAQDSLAERWGTPDEVAAVAKFLLSREASYISGQTIEVDGGLKRAGAR